MTANLFRLLAIAAPSKALPALLAGVLAAGAGIALIGTAAWIIASAALQPPLSALALAITLVRACGIGRAVFRYLDRLLSHRLAFACYEDLQQATYRRSAATIPLREGNVREGAFLHDLLTGCETLRDFYLRTVPQPLIAGMLTAVSCTALLPLIPWGALLIAFLYLLHLALPHFLHETELRAESTVYREILLDRLDGRTELTAAGTRTQAQRQLDHAAEDFQRKQNDKRTKRERLFTGLDVLRVAVWILLIVLLMPRVADGILTGVQYAVWVLVLEAVLSEYRSLPSASLGAVEAVRAAETILPSKKNLSEKNLSTSLSAGSTQRSSARAVRARRRSQASFCASGRPTVEQSHIEEYRIPPFLPMHHAPSLELPCREVISSAHRRAITFCVCMRIWTSSGCGRHLRRHSLPMWCGHFLRDWMNLWGQMPHGSRADSAAAFSLHSRLPPRPRCSSSMNPQQDWMQSVVRA